MPLLSLVLAAALPMAAWSSPMAPPPPAERAQDARAREGGGAWSEEGRERVEGATRRHVEILNRLSERVGEEARTEIERVRVEAVDAREAAARAFQGSSRNEMEEARESVRRSFRQSRTALNRLVAGLERREAGDVESALERIEDQQSRALRGFDEAMGVDSGGRDRGGRRTIRGHPADPDR
ncbi:MAG TPA: hypothetical protein VJV23_13210 [Candidatus Polarisedimenticolia bacterium]|nr:hypothetical protein [Candidatus Polarisedimenticolia bacterium]